MLQSLRSWLGALGLSVVLVTILAGAGQAQSPMPTVAFPDVPMLLADPAQCSGNQPVTVGSRF